MNLSECFVSKSHGIFERVALCYPYVVDKHNTLIVRKKYTWPFFKRVALKGGFKFPSLRPSGLSLHRKSVANFWSK